MSFVKVLQITSNNENEVRKEYLGSGWNER